MEKGIERGIEKGIELAILKAHKSGQTVEFTASMFEISVDKVKRVIEQHR
jgi:predicted transposase YdaD